MPRVGDAPLVHDMYKRLLLVSLLQAKRRVKTWSVMSMHCLSSASLAALVASDCLLQESVRHSRPAQPCIKS